jgi:hypothetical protein
MRRLKEVAGWGKREWVLTLRFREWSPARRSGKFCAIPRVFRERIPASRSSRFFRWLWELARIRPSLRESMDLRLRSLPVRQPDRLVEVSLLRPRQQAPLLLSRVAGDRARTTRPYGIDRSRPRGASGMPARCSTWKGTESLRRTTRFGPREISILRLALFGIAIGIPSALLSTRLIASMLSGLSPGDLPAVTGVSR